MSEKAFESNRGYGVYDLSAVNVGLIPLGVQHVYDGLVKLQNCSVEVSVLEVYNERVRDFTDTS
eukprot:5084839-Amphidinium_carterae.2